MRLHLFLAVCGLAIALAAPGRAGAQAGEGPDASPAAANPESVQEPAPEDAHGRDTPRGAVRGYLEAARDGDFARAAQFLDLRRLSGSAQERGPELARQLKVVLDRNLWVDVDSLSNEPEGMRNDGLPVSRDRIGTFEARGGPVEILAQRVPDGSGGQVWKISSATVARVPALYDEYGYGPVEELLPEWLVTITLLDLALWHWVALLVLVLLAGALSWAAAMLLELLVRPLARRSATQFDDRLVHATAGPLRLLIAIGLFHLGTLPLGLSVPARRFLAELEQALAIVAVAWFLIRIVNILTLLVVSRLRERGQATATAVVPLGQKAVKVVIFGFAFIALLDSFGVNVTALLAGLGVGGIAVALAAQKTVENLFGGITLFADQPVRVGDFCRFGDKVGTIEEIGLRSTRVRTLDRTLVSVPNADFSSLQLENFTARDKIWFHPRIGVRYETTAEQLRYILVEVRKMLYAHPRVDPEPARIRFVQFGAYSLDLDIFAYVRTQDYGEYLEIAEDLNLRIMDIIEASGSGFAFPSQTLYVGKDDGLDAEHAKQAEGAVADWRENRELYLPRFSPEKIRELDDTLEYPVPGSPHHQPRSK